MGTLFRTVARCYKGLCQQSFQFPVVRCFQHLLVVVVIVVLSSFAEQDLFHALHIGLVLVACFEGTGLGQFRVEFECFLEFAPSNEMEFGKEDVDG